MNIIVPMSDIANSALQALIDKLNLTQTITLEQAIELGRNKTVGIGASRSFTQDEFQSYLKEIKDDLEKQCHITSRFFDFYIQTGDSVPPHYPMRIAIILSKAKQKQAELNFLNAWCRHYPDKESGLGYSKLITRRDKLAAKMSN